MNNYKLIILDFDGTLCATHKAILFCIKEAYQAVAKNAPRPERSRAERAIRTGVSMEGVLKMISPELPHVKIRKLLDVYEHIYLQEGEKKSTAFPKANEVLATLHAAEFILAVVSNKALPAVEAGLDRFGLRQYITAIVGETQTMRKKPDPMAYTELIKPKFSTIPPNEILMVGDTATDLLFANNISAGSCWAAYGYGDAKACRSLKPNYVIKNLSDLLTILL